VGKVELTESAPVASPLKVEGEAVGKSSEPVGASDNDDDDDDDHEESSAGKQARGVLDALRRQLTEAREALDVAEQQLAQRVAQQVGDAASEEAIEKKVKWAVNKAEKGFDRQLTAVHEFWRSAARTSARPSLGAALDLRSAEVLGNGRYGFVFRAKRTAAPAGGGIVPSVVVKMLSVRWAHVAAKEWGQAHLLGEHEHIVRYEDVFLHADVDQRVACLLQTARKQGVLHERSKRAAFPDTLLCLTLEFMNRGSVQSWMDRDALLPGGMLVVMQRVASALAFMHHKGVTHNDIKPENVLLHQADEDDPRSEVVVKLADLGLAENSYERAADFKQYGMTVHCMTTGAKFGSTKLREGDSDELVSEVAELIGDNPSKAETGIAAALAELPALLRIVLKQDITMGEMKDHPRLQGWGFFDAVPPEAPRADGRAPHDAG